MSAEELQRRAAEFPIDGYLTVGSPRRSSFTVGNERAAAFFWQAVLGLPLVAVVGFAIWQRFGR